MKLEYGCVIFVLVAVIITAGCLTGTVSVTPEPVTYQQPMKVANTYSQSTVTTYSTLLATPTETKQSSSFYTIGQSATISDRVITVLSYEEPKQYGSWIPVSTDKLLVINLDVKNIGSDDIWVSSNDFVLSDSEGYQEKPLFLESSSAEWILPKLKSNFHLVFQIPKNKTGLTLHYEVDPRPKNGERIVTWKLT